MFKKEVTVAGHWSEEGMANRKHKDSKGERNSTYKGQPSG